jgi:hypothetical protein
MLITAIVCLFGKLHLDGVIDVHQDRETPSYFYFIEPLIDWFLLALPLYIIGSNLSISKIRFIDIAGTTALARYPIFFVVILTMVFPSHTNDPQKFINEIQNNPGMLLQIILLGLLILPFIVWMTALMFNAFSISANLKGPKAVWSFVASILIAEILSKVIFSLLI